VPQIPELFDGTLAENIRLGNAMATDEEILRALDVTDLTKESASLPLGLDTQIKTSGESLPVSLVYRIGLARAYVRNSAVILFDELPSAILNGETGKRFVERVRAWHGGRTILMVTHRDDLIRMSDRAIGLLSGGRVLVGAPEDVIQKLRDGTFAQNGRFA
jgi:ABC-type multidrug transport system fused ATPase/permease subunit